MAISGDYSKPVTVNGFSCRNCTEVDEAKKHIDPAHPKDGPYGVNARGEASSGSRGPAVVLGGALATAVSSGSSAPSASPPQTAGQVDLYA